MQPLLPLKSNKYYILWVCFGSLSCPSCNVHAPYCLLWHAQLYNILPHSHKLHDLQKKKLLNMKCVAIFSTTFVWNISHSKKNWVRYEHNVYWSLCKVAIILSDFNETWIFKFSKNTQTSNFTKISAVAAKLFHADGHTWQTWRN
jgi:hypothetical protein